MKFPLYSPNIVIFYVIRNGSDETVLSFKLSTVIHLSLEYSPRSLPSGCCLYNERSWTCCGCIHADS